MIKNKFFHFLFCPKSICAASAVVQKEANNVRNETKVCADRIFGSIKNGNKEPTPEK
jgi:hypothetical protein